MQQAISVFYCHSKTPLLYLKHPVLLLINFSSVMMIHCCLETRPILLSPVFNNHFCLVDNGLDMPSIIYNSIKRVSVVFLWVKTSSAHCQRAVLLTKWLFVYYALYLQTINVKQLFVYMSGNKQSIWTQLSHVRQFGHVYCLY